MKLAVADLFYRLLAEQRYLEVDIEECQDPKAGVRAIGRWIEIDTWLEDLAEAILRHGKITVAEVRELRLKFGSRWTQQVLKIINLEVCDENGGKLSPCAIDPRFGR